MRARGLLGFVAMASVSCVSIPGAAMVLPKQDQCRKASLTGEVKAGESYRKLIGNGLAVVLQSVASGWILRVDQATGAQGEHDYAELATPPYNSVTPLSISTDFSFRAQDAIGWNPRDFRFATNVTDYGRFLSAYKGLAAPGATPSPAAEQEMVSLLGRAAQGRLRILDARLVPGTADQWRMAATVASHFNSTAHSVDESAKPTPLGKILWLKFQIDLELPASFSADRSLRIVSSGCGV